MQQPHPYEAAFKVTRGLRTMTLVFGLIRLCIGIFLAVFAFGFRKPKSGGFLTKYPIFAKALSIICVVSGLYSIFLADSNSYSLNRNQTWTEEDKKALRENCIRDSKDMLVKFPKEINDYCSCSTSGITENMSKKEYLENSKKPLEERMRVQLKYFQNCLAELKRVTAGQK